MNQGDESSRTAQEEIIFSTTTPEHHNLHRILVTKCSSSPPRSRSQSAGSAHKEALLFFERHQLFQSKEEQQLQKQKHQISDSVASSPLGGKSDARKNTQNDDEESLIRKRSIRGRSHSQPSQVLLCTRTTGIGGGTGSSSSTTHTHHLHTGSSSGDIERQEKKCSSWLEQIQFTAQYQHYRTNDYSSVVNSASSLDKTDGSAAELRRGQISGIATHEGAATSSLKHSCVTPPTNNKAPPFCFHFPRVKLPRIFNTKSLDDILGTKSSSTRSNKSHSKLLSSTTSSCTSPHPNNLEIDLDSNSSVGITTPGITNTTGGTTLTEGFTTTSGYFSDLDRRESCDLLVVDQEPYEFGDDDGERRRHSSLVSYCEIKVGTRSGDTNRDVRSSITSTTLPPIALNKISSSGVTHPNVASGESKSRKWSGSSLHKTTSTLTSALLRIPPFASDNNKSPKSKANKHKQLKCNTKKPSKSLSSGSLNRVSVGCANPTNGISTCAKATTTTTSTNPIAKQITKSDNYLNRIVTSTSARFFSVSGKSAECSSTGGRNSKAKTNKAKKDKENISRSSISGTSVSEFSTTADSDQSQQPTQRKWTAVKHKWDLKLQLPPVELLDSSNSNNQPDESQRLLFIRSQIGQLVEAQARQRQASLDYGNSQSPTKSVVRPHEAGRVSFRLEPEEIPDTSLLKNSSSFNSNTSNSSPVISPSVSCDCHSRETCSIESHQESSHTSSQDRGLDTAEMTKSQTPHHFHYAQNNPSSSSNSSSKGRNRRNNANNQPLGNAQSNNASNPNEKVHLVVANVSFLQRPISPCRPGHTLLSSTPTPTISPGVHLSSSPGQASGSGDSSAKCTKSSKSIITNRNNINEAKLIGENINVSRGGGGCGLSCLRYNRDDVVSPSSGSGMDFNKDLKKGSCSSEGAKKSMYGKDKEEDSSCASNNKSKKNKEGDRLLHKSAGTTTRSGGVEGRSLLQNQSQFGQYRPGDDVDYSDSTLTRFHPDLNNSSSIDPKTRSEFLTEDGDTDKMGDLQSPTYVKRTAHMFNSIYSSSQNGSTPVGEHNPSYLNVSKSVSGYSCLSYNGNNTTNGSAVTNGSSTTPNNTKRISNGASSSASPYSHRFVNGAGNSLGSSSNRSELTIKVNQNQERNGSHSRELALSPSRQSNSPYPDPDVPDSSSTYVPSHGKSFIMQRIERLYGSDAHSVTASTGIATRKSVNQSGVGGTVTTIKFETLHHHQPPSRGKETIIPIQVEKENKPEAEDVSNSFVQSSIVSKDREIHDSISPVSSGYERCFRGDEILIQQEDNDEHNNTIINQKDDHKFHKSETEEPSEMKPIDYTSIAAMGSGVSVEPCPGQHKLETITLDEREKQLLISSSSTNNTNSKANGDQIVAQPVEISTDIITKPVALTRTKVSIADLKDGNYFLQEMRKTIKELQRLADKASPELETLDQQSDRAGNILAAIGKSNLLIKKKFKQFEGLCNANLQGVASDEPATTNDDLAGFWDMVMIQVEQVYSSFKDIEDNNSGDTDIEPKTTTSPKKTVSTTRTTKPTASKSQTSAAAKARDESRRKMLAERRRQLKDQTQDEGTKAQEDVLIFTPENN